MSTAVCSFCGKREDEDDVKYIIVGPRQKMDVEVQIALHGGEIASGITATGMVSATICDMCVAVCDAIIAQNKKSEAAPGPAQTTEENPHD